jgi:ABC-2 type transport system permease protein
MNTALVDLHGSERGRASLFRATRAVAKRNLRKALRTPQLMLVGILQGAMFLLIFRYVFGGAINVNGVPYVDFLLPGFVTTGVLFVGSGVAVGVAEDLNDGFIDRLRSLPSPRAGVLLGRAVSETAMLVWSTAVTVGIGFAVGFRLHASWAQATAAFALCILFGFAFVWLFVLLGLLAGNGQAAQGMSMIIFPLSFVSSAYVPVDSMPGWLQSFANHQPLTVMVDAVRALCLGDKASSVLGHSSGHYIGPALVWTLVICAVFAPLAAMRFNSGK